MSVETVPGTDIKYGLISFDAQGRERPEGAKPMSDQIIERAANANTSNVFFFAHGWQGDVLAARDQYNRWIGALMRSTDLQRAAQVFPGFAPLLVGLHWPSEPWGDEELSGGGAFGGVGGAAPVSADELLQRYLDILGDDPAIRAPLKVIINEARGNVAPDSLPPTIRKAYLDLNQALGLESKGVGAAPDADREGFDPDDAFEGATSFGDLNLGGILAPLRQLSYWTMKKRARSIGEGGMHSFLIELQQATEARRTRVHLMGHSFGTIVVSSMVGGPNARGPLPRPVDSLVLVQGAVSLWSYASSIPFHGAGRGYFNPILEEGKLTGPIVATQSVFDKAVGIFYPLASRLNGSVEFGAPGSLPEFGAIGAFGIQGVASAASAKMLDVDGDYAFDKQRVYNLESSRFIVKGDGPSGAHSDIDGPQVAHAIWEAAFASK